MAKSDFDEIVAYLLEPCWTAAARSTTTGARKILEERLAGESEHFGFDKRSFGFIREILAIPKGYELSTMLADGNPDGPLVIHRFGWAKGLSPGELRTAKLSATLAKTLVGLDDALTAALTRAFGLPIRPEAITSIPNGYRKVFPEMTKRRREALMWNADSVEVRLERRDQPMMGGYSWYVAELDYVSIDKTHNPGDWRRAAASP